jgi:hypothetical protein
MCVSINECVKCCWSSFLLCSSGCIGKQRDLIAKNNFSQGHFRFSQKHALCFDSFWRKKRPRIRERAMRSRISRGASNYVTGGVDFWSSHCYINHFRGFHFSAFSLLRRLVNARVSFISLTLALRVRPQRSASRGPQEKANQPESRKTDPGSRHRRTSKCASRKIILHLLSARNCHSASRMTLRANPSPFSCSA